MGSIRIDMLDERSTRPRGDAGPSNAAPIDGTSREGPYPGTNDGGAPLQLPLTREQRESVKILVVDDEETILESTVNVLQHEGFHVTGLSRASEAEARLRSGAADIVLLDLFMTGISGPRLLKTALDARPDAIAILITGRPSVESSIRAAEDGAWGYLPKPFSATHLRVLVGQAAHTVIVSRESRESTHKRRVQGADELVHLGESPAFRAVVSLARKVAATDASAMITGESGTGKELVAQVIHRTSRRRNAQMVAVNCAALPEPLLESEMFGHVKGAFTGATRDRAGLMEMADGGTLFLDELVEMSPMTQAKLLRVVQDGVVRRVGSSRTDAVVDVRFVSATNCNPASAVEEGRLREDLYYRLGVVHIHIPPLRQRPEDIRVLAEHFLYTYWLRHRGIGRQAPTFTQEAMRELHRRPWRGNIRELQNAIEHAIVLADGRDIIDAPDLPELPHNGNGGSHLNASHGDYEGAGETYHGAREQVLACFEKEYLTWVLQKTDGNVSEAARVADVNRATLYRLLERHDLTKSDVVED